MKVITEQDFISSKKTAVALGVFDGIHRGHQDVVKKATNLKNQGYSPAVFTFNTNTVTSKGNGKLDALISNELKYKKLEDLGVEYIYSPEFSAVRDLTAEKFVEKILVKKLNAGVVVCGENFRFGKGAFCGYKELSQICEGYDIKTIVVPFTMYNGQPISSTEIRRLIKEGSIDIANFLLGYDFHFKGEVVHGNSIGRTISFPTINQHFERSQVIPRFGVYASITKIGDKEYNSITNIGVKPTVGNENAPLAETHIIDFDNDLYGEKLVVHLKRFIRPEQKFNGLDELKGQLIADTQKAKAILSYNNEKGGFHNE